MGATWTLESELRTLAGDDNITSALRHLNLLPLVGQPYELTVIQDWYPAGAETYLLIFGVRQARHEHRYVMKACTASLGLGLAETFKIWLQRRKLVTGLGVSTPTLVATSTALLVEEYIPYSVIDALAQSQGPAREKLLTALGRTAGLLVNAGFVPVSTHDWRSRGDDVVLVDFGQDLGSPGMAIGTNPSLLAELMDRIERSKLNLDGAEIRCVDSGYESAVKS